MAQKKPAPQLVVGGRDPVLGDHQGHAIGREALERQSQPLGIDLPAHVAEAAWLAVVVRKAILAEHQSLPARRPAHDGPVVIVETDEIEATPRRAPEQKERQAVQSQIAHEGGGRGRAAVADCKP